MVVYNEPDLLEQELNVELWRLAIEHSIHGDLSNTRDGFENKLVVRDWVLGRADQRSEFCNRLLGRQASDTL